MADAECKCRLIVGVDMLLLLECTIVLHLEFTLRTTRDNSVVSLLKSGGQHCVKVIISTGASLLPDVCSLSKLLE